VTREQAAWLAPGVRLVAKDLDGSMLRVAHRRGAARAVTWRQPDAMALRSMMPRSMRWSASSVRCSLPTRRVSLPSCGGCSARAARSCPTWGPDRDERFRAGRERGGERALSGRSAALSRAPAARVWVRGSDRARSGAGGFATRPLIETVATDSCAGTAGLVARAYCLGTPLRIEIEARDPAGLEAATAEALSARSGVGP
jgi:hypothetical protein